MTGAERQRAYIARREAKAVAAAAAKAPPPPSPSLPTPRLAESREPEQAGTSQCEWLIESGWSFGRIERFIAACARTLARHREAEAEPEGS